ncbi:hypothetical protein [Bacillus altitudinis]|uniref:hypothetical protein n=1 Tax=Bacillus altitudinis TaxID=293387 RepID=UPI002E2498D1|nr:hypothetical protein [Bacillus altitudinis]
MQEDIKFENGDYIIPEKIMMEILKYIDELKELAEEMHATILDKDINSEWGIDLKIDWPHISIEKHYCCVIGEGEPYSRKRGFREILERYARHKCDVWVGGLPGQTPPYDLLEKNCDHVLTWEGESQSTNEED